MGPEVNVALEQAFKLEAQFSMRGLIGFGGNLTCFQVFGGKESGTDLVYVYLHVLGHGGAGGAGIHVLSGMLGHAYIGLHRHIWCSYPGLGEFKVKVDTMLLLKLLHYFNSTFDPGFCWYQYHHGFCFDYW
ncbi:hypothetical protein SLA2020_315450 [Shorea laevis]